MLQALIELDTPIQDGRVVIPVPDDGLEKYEAFVRLVHGVTPIDAMSLDECLGIYECADFLGSEMIMDTAMHAVWTKAPRPKTVHALAVVPRLLAHGGDVAQDVVHHASVDHPLWPDAIEDFLGPIASALDASALRALLRLQKFYPPAAVALWIMMRRVMTEDIALELATFDEYTPGELAVVCEELHRRYSLLRWVNDPLMRLLDTFKRTLLDTDDVPVPRVVVGHRVEFMEPRFVVNAYVTPRYKRLRAPFDITPLVRLRLPHKDVPFAFEVHVGKLLSSGLPHRPPSVQVRLTVSKCASMAKSVYDSWYVISLASHSTNTGWVDAGVPWREIGHITESLREHYARGMYIRFDVRYDAKSVLDV